LGHHQQVQEESVQEPLGRAEVFPGQVRQGEGWKHATFHLEGEAGVNEGFGFH
jgi:hypothetical protein